MVITDSSYDHSYFIVISFYLCYNNNERKLIMKEKSIDRYMSKYRDIRGTLVKKRKCLFGSTMIFVISDGKETVPVKVGKGLDSIYPVGCKLTIGYIGRKLINIRPGIVYDDK